MFDMIILFWQISMNVLRTHVTMVVQTIMVDSAVDVHKALKLEPEGKLTCFFFYFYFYIFFQNPFWINLDASFFLIRPCFRNLSQSRKIFEIKNLLLFGFVAIFRLIWLKGTVPYVQGPTEENNYAKHIFSSNKS